MMISLVIPVKSEEHSIGKLLAAISNETRLPDEVIFVDAGSTDKTKDMITSYRDNRLNLRVLSIGPAYPGTARNEGIKSASYNNIAFTDGGIELDKDWLKELSDVMEKDSSCDVVYGSYIPCTDTLFKQCLAMAIVPPLAKRTPFIASSLIKKSVWQDVGGFPDLRAAEDRVFMEFIEKRGFNIRYAPEAIVIWDIPENIKKTFARFYNYSYHDLKTGRISDWHFPVLRMYVVAFLFFCLAIFVSPYFLLFPLLGFIIRTIHKIIINRSESYLKSTNFFLYSFLTGFLVFLIDTAMFAGWSKYIIRGQKE